MTRPDTNMIGQWQDVTSYDQRDKERVPSVFAAQAGTVRIVVTNSHIHYKPDWVMHCAAVGINTKAMKAKTLEDAKAEALSTVDNAICKLTDDFDRIRSAYK